MTLAQWRIVATLPASAGDLKDEVVDKLCDEISDAMEMSIRAVLENLQEKFPSVRFTVVD